MSPLEKLVRLFNTLRWLRPVQWYGRFWFMFSRPAIPPDGPATARSSTGRFVSGLPRPRSFSSPDVFTFLGSTHRLSEVGWNNPEIPRLWRYQQHYFDGLLAPELSEPEAAGWISRWMRENPLGGTKRGGTPWEPYPTSLRIVNWIRWHWKCQSVGGVGLDAVAISSLARQGEWLSKRLEHHLLGNHLWANAKALVFAGAVIDGAAAKRWSSVGARLLERELAEQTLPDGGHFELSPMYHAIFAEDVLDLLALGEAYPTSLPSELVESLRSWAPRLIAFLKGMSHPDGLPGQFNDTALGEGPALTQLVSYAERLGFEPPKYRHPEQLGGTLWADSGYARLVTGEGDGAVVLADVGRAGPDYIPGHAHADALSFEMSLHGRRLFVNGGTSTYEASEERLRQRGTRAHNTVSVGGADSSEVWSSFRLARRITDVRSSLEIDTQAVHLFGEFRGFHSLGRPVRHRRHWQLVPGEFVVTDRVDGNFGSCESRLHVAPAWIASRVGDAIELVCGNEVVSVIADGEMSLERGVWARSFGENIPVDVISMPFSGVENCFRIRWVRRDSSSFMA